MQIAVNVIVIYAAWFAAVLSAAADRPYSAAAASVVAIVVNVSASSSKYSELKLVLAVGVVGLAADGPLVHFGLTRYASPGPYPTMPPAWIILMWMAFGTTLNVSLRWLQNRLVLSALLGMLAGPMSYYAGARLGGMHFSQPTWAALCAVGAMWAFAFPLLLLIARRRSYKGELG